MVSNSFQEEMFVRTIFVLLLCVVLIPSNASPLKPGAYLGANPSELPRWFKLSFLDFEEDIAEAAEQNKRVMIYFHQDGCPYCARLIEENFTDPEIQAYVRGHFDGIEINMWGDREIVSVGGDEFTEKTFAAALKVQYTPTLMFFNESGQVALRINGYYPPAKFRRALQYVAERQETKQSFNEFMLAGQSDGKGGLIKEDFFLDQTDLKAILAKADKPLAIYFESVDCVECKMLHEKILTDTPTRELVKDMHNVQFNVHSDREIVTPEGDRISQRDYAKQLNIGYTPAVVLLDPQGQEVHRMEGFLKTFHFQSSLAYVLEKAYEAQPSFQRYIAA